MRRILLATLLLTPMLASAQSPFERRYSVRVELDAQGRVGGIKAVGDVREELVPVVEAAAARAEFEPATRAGQPVPSATTLSVKVRYEKTGRDYRANVVDVVAHGGLVSPASPPFPYEAVKRGYGGRVLARVAFRADGSVDLERSRIESGEVQRESGKPSPLRVAEFEKAFRESALAVLPKWKYAPDVIAGESVAATVIVPLTFCTPRMAADCDERFTDAKDVGPKPPVPVDADLRLASLKPAADAPATTGG